MTLYTSNSRDVAGSPWLGPNEQTFNLHSPNLGAYKNWISQGLVADKTVAVADLFIKGKSFGPHAFVMNLRENGKPVNPLNYLPRP